MWQSTSALQRGKGACPPCEMTPLPSSFSSYPAPSPVVPSLSLLRASPLPPPSRVPPSPAMSLWGESSAAAARSGVGPRSRLRQGGSMAADEVGEETGLPLIQCPLCKVRKVIELRTVTDERGNLGRVFFKCPGNVARMPGRCKYYEWQKEYLKDLVKLKIVEIHAGGNGGEDNGGPDNGETVPEGGNGVEMEAKLESLIRAIKLLVVVLSASVVIGIMSLLK